MKEFFAWTHDEWQSHLAAAGFTPVHAASLFRHVYRDLGHRPWDEPGLPKALKAHLEAEFSYAPVTVGAARVSGYDHSVKFLARMKDGAAVETVLMPESRRVTLCLSSQVGCAQACVFCHTGRMGLTRHLTAAEIVGQVAMAERWMKENPEWRASARLPAGARVSNVVFMGMGEPLDNVANVCQAVRILTDAHGFSLALKRVSVSTAGHLDGIKAFFAAFPRGALALSLHATQDGERSRLMPINRRWPMADVLAYLREHFATVDPKGSVLVQYTVIDKVNDAEEKAVALAELLRGLPAKVNLIPLNEVGPSRLGGPSAERLARFRDVIHAKGVRVMVRYSKGQDIAAACGQLALAESRAKARDGGGDAGAASPA